MVKRLLFLIFIFFTQEGYTQIYLQINTNSCDSSIVGNFDARYAGEIDGSSADWNCPNILDTANSTHGCLVLMNDGITGMTSGIGSPPLDVPKYTLGCDTSNYTTQDLTGKIAVIYRGNCEFGLKAYNAQKRGAIGVIIINHTGEAVNMAGAAYGTLVNIPVIMIGRNDGDLLVSCLDTICLGINGSILPYKVKGKLYNDFYRNCVKDNSNSEHGIQYLTATINPGNKTVVSNIYGDWYLDSLPIGNYSITYDTTNYWHSDCPLVSNFSVTNTSNITDIGNFGYIPNFGFPGGYIYFDPNETCNVNLSTTIKQRKGIINPGNILVQSDINGYWSVDSLILGNYTITLDTSGYYINTCPSPFSFSVANIYEDSLIHIGLNNTNPCPSPNISVHMPIIRPCTNQIIFVEACNLSSTSEAIPNGYVELELDALLTPTSSSIPYTSLGNNTYSFDVGTLTPGQCVNFSVNTTVSCSTVLGQTLCMQANLYPADSCVFDQNPTPPVGGVQPCTLPWDNSSLSVDGWCQNDTVYFSVTNTGSAVNGNMQCYSPIRVYVDGVLTYLDSLMLTGGQTIIFSYFGNGQTWTLQADQHPLHPGNSHPNASVEACGDSSNWTPGLINTLSLDDADPVVDIYCGVVTSSYDPNDKTGYPLGVGNDHFVAPNGKIDYVIRFQNTGTDTAFTVVVRDTLDVDLDIFSVQSGVSSHNYTFRMYGPRVLEWTFNNILLPDSTTDEPASNGFVTLTVNQNPNLPDGTVINNRVGIYFDFNEPIITNTTTHTVNRGINYLLAINPSKILSNNSLFIYPNPTKTLLNIVVPDAQSLKIDVYTIDGKLIEQKTITKNTALDVSKYQIGLYFIHATNSRGEVFRNKFVKE